MRRQLLSFDDWVHPAYKHQTSPRKWRTLSACPSIDTARYHSSYEEPVPGSVPHSWIGKKIVFWDGEPLASYNDKNFNVPGHVHEYHISRYCRPNIYRFLFMRGGQLVSNPTQKYCPSRMNIYLEDNKIIKIAYH